MPNVEDRISSIDTRVCVGGCIAFAGGGAVGAGGTAVPGRSIVNRVAPGVVNVEEQPVRHLAFQRSLQRIVIGVDRVLPKPQLEVIWVQGATRSGSNYPQVVGNLDSRRQIS